jgi:uncharacterized membrane protein YfcA
MDLMTTAFLAGAGVIAGIIATMVGGAAVVIYPALIATGVPPQLAAVSNLASVMPATMLAALSDRSQLPHFNRLGAALLLLMPERMFAQIVPLLLGFATLLFAYSERISHWLRARAEGHGHAISFNFASLKVVLSVSFYDGYFGILMLGVYSRWRLVASIAPPMSPRTSSPALSASPQRWSSRHKVPCYGLKRSRSQPELVAA